MSMEAITAMLGHRSLDMTLQRARGSLHRHATYIVAAYLAGAAR
jgi:hypothetical protein